jgi:hypothetical protein
MEKSVKDLARETLETVYDLSPYEWTDTHQAFVLGFQIGRPRWVNVARECPQPYDLHLWALPDIGVILARLSDFSYDVTEESDVFWMAVPEAPSAR